MASIFHGPIDAHVAIPAPHCGPGGTMHFNFGSALAEEQKRKREPFSTVPFAPDADFVDRPEILAWVRDRCARPGARAALVGLGGVGKSQLAIHHAHSVRDATPQTYVFWVHASSRPRFEEAYRDIADRLDLPGRQDPKADVLRLVSEWLRDEANGRWTMVLDNVDDVETFFPSRKRQRNELDETLPLSLASFLPQSRNGSILITSRSKDAAARLAGGHNYIKEVLAMDEGQGMQLLSNKLQCAPITKGTAELVQALDYMPLAITQAAAYISRRARMTIAGYLEKFRADSKKRESLLNWDAGDLRRDESASNSVVTTWQISFERIRQERPSAANLLSLMSCFNPQGIPESVLRRHSRDMAQKSEEDTADDAFDEDVDLLQAYSLVVSTAATDMLEMHALVQFCTRVWLSSFGNAEKWRSEFVQLMAREFSSGQYETWAQCQQLFPHVESLFESEPATDMEAKLWAMILTSAAWYMLLNGSYETAQKIATMALTARERLLGRGHEMTLLSVTVLAVALQAQGKWDNAETLHRRVLESQKELGEQHSFVLANINNLAEVLRAQGRYDEAETLNRQALKGLWKKLGDQHPRTLMSISNLALVLQDQGKYKEAERLQQRALEGKEKKLGNQHPHTLISVFHIARLMHEQKRYELAAELYQRACDGLEQQLGFQNPTTTACRNRFLNMQQEAKQTSCPSDKKSNPNDTTLISEASSCDVTS